MAIQAATGQYIQRSPGEQRPVPAQPVTPQEPTCDERPLNTRNWDVSPNLQIHEATTCRFRATWKVNQQNRHGKWPRTYDYHPDRDGWISDVFIAGPTARVSWNLKSNAVRVQARDGGTVDRATAETVARHAKRTVFPGIDLSKLSF